MNFINFKYIKEDIKWFVEKVFESIDISKLNLIYNILEQ